MHLHYKSKILLLFFMFTKISSLFAEQEYIGRDQLLHETNAQSISRAPSASSINQYITSTALNSSVSAATNGGQFVISKSGHYVLSTDIFAAPAASRTPCIYINTSNVTLDLGGKTLSLSSTTNQKNISAIEIAANAKNITIMNGTLDGRAGTSSVYTTTGIMVKTGASNILVDKVNVVNFAERGLVFDTDCSNIILNKVHAYNNGITASFAARSVTFGSCDDITILDSTFNKTNSTCPNSTYGIFFDSCTNVLLTNVQVSDTTATAGTIRGIWFYNTSGAICENVQVLASTSGSNAVSEIIGIDVLGSSGCMFSRCIASNGLSTHYSTSTYGFKLANNANSNTFINCQANNNRGGGTSVAFKLASSHYNTFQECSAVGNGGSSHLTYGIQSGLNTGSGTSTDLTLSCSGNTFSKCKINSNVANVGDCFGVDLSAETSSTVQDCEIRANIASGKAYGVALHHTCVKNIIEYNKIYANSGTNGQYG
ncbi:hypothetical protein FJ364_00420, partial [Candidatus Dependentiae bacterium]|nr:hypothetical protein [Candidatus Dependentiae bacterium]